MRELDVHENIDVSDTKLMLGLRVCYISSALTVNKLFPINPRAVTGPPKMSLLLEVESTSALIIEPRLIVVMYTDDLGGNITSNQQGKMLIQNLHRIVRRPNVTPGQILHCTTDCIPINLVFQEKTQVRNSLLLLLLKKVGSARLRESGIHPISQKTPVPQYQPIDRKKRKGKRVEDYSMDRAA